MGDVGVIYPMTRAFSMIASVAISFYLVCKIKIEKTRYAKELIILLLLFCSRFMAFMSCTGSDKFQAGVLLCC